MKTSTGSIKTFPAMLEATSPGGAAKNGSTLMMVMMLVMVVGFMLGTLYFGASQRTFSLVRHSNRTKALTIAEAGLGDAFNYLAEDHSRISNDPLVLNDDFSDGSYVVRASVPSGADDGVILLTATGTYRGQTMESMATVLLESGAVEESGETPVLPLGPFGSAALLAGADIILSGGVNIYLEGEGAHANGSVIMSGSPRLEAGYLSTNGSILNTGNPNIVISGTPSLTTDSGANRIHADGPIEYMQGNFSSGDISSSVSVEQTWSSYNQTVIAPVLVHPNWNPFRNSSTQAVPNVAPMVLPPLDVEAFLTYAQSNDYYYEGDQNIGRGWLTADILRRTGVNVTNNQTLFAPAGGVLFVNGNVTIAQDMDFEGVIVATGNVVLQGNSTLTNPTDYPAIVSVDGDISLGGGWAGLTVDGWVYAMNGSVTCSGGAAGMSGIIAAQDIEIKQGYNLGQAGELNEMNWPGGTGGETGGGGSGESSLRLLSWIR